MKESCLDYIVGYRIIELTLPNVSLFQEKGRPGKMRDRNTTSCVYDALGLESGGWSPALKLLGRNTAWPEERFPIRIVLVGL